MTSRLLLDLPQLLHNDLCLSGSCCKRQTPLLTKVSSVSVLLDNAGMLSIAIPLEVLALLTQAAVQTGAEGACSNRCWIKES